MIWFLYGISLKSKLVHFDRERSNALFEELADWNEVLKHSEADLRGPKL